MFLLLLLLLAAVKLLAMRGPLRGGGRTQLVKDEEGSGAKCTPVNRVVPVRVPRHLVRVPPFPRGRLRCCPPQFLPELGVRGAEADVQGGLEVVGQRGVAAAPRAREGVDGRDRVLRHAAHPHRRAEHVDAAAEEVQHRRFRGHEQLPAAGGPERARQRDGGVVVHPVVVATVMAAVVFAATGDGEFILVVVHERVEGV